MVGIPIINFDNIKQGRIIWIIDNRGGNKKRPAVVLSQPDIDGNVNVIVGTTQTTGSKTEIELPFFNSLNGHPKTKLKERTVVNINWRETIPDFNILEIGGWTPLVTMKKILDAIANIAESVKLTTFQTFADYINKK